jgi:hypothetical protein
VDRDTAFKHAQDFLRRLYELVSAPTNIPKLRALYEDPQAGPPIELQGQYDWARACFQIEDVEAQADGILKVWQNVAFLIAERTKARWVRFLPGVLPQVPPQRIRLVWSEHSSLLLVPSADGSYRARVDPSEAHLKAGTCWTDDWMTHLFALPKEQPLGLPGGSSCDCDHATAAAGENQSDVLAATSIGSWSCVGVAL